MGAAAHPRLRVGVDVCDVARMTRVIDAQPGVARRLFTQGELARCHRARHAGQHLAARFAAKEAVFKAFGTGIAHGMRWKEVEVVADAAGRPGVQLHGTARAWAAARGLLDLDVSLTHDAGVALAHVVTLWEASDGRVPYHRPPDRPL
jgi:holo-[acyl-carrier protein] synthase